MAFRNSKKESSMEIKKARFHDETTKLVINNRDIKKLFGIHGIIIIKR